MRPRPPRCGPKTNCNEYDIHAQPCCSNCNKHFRGCPHQRHANERLPSGRFCVRAPHTFRLCKGYFIEAHRAGPDKLGVGAASKAIKRLAHTRSQEIGRKALTLPLGLNPV